jgi:hypothetical protein
LVAMYVVPPLEWSAQRAAAAKQWVNEVAATGKFAHRPKDRYGADLIAIRGARARPAEVVAAWASEVKDYDSTGNACRAGKVWATTRNWFGAIPPRWAAASLERAHATCGCATMMHRAIGRATGRIEAADEGSGKR